MSLSYQQLNAVEVRDPRTIVQTQRDYAVLKAGSQTTWKAWSSPSVSNSSIQWSCPPPSGAVFVDSKIYVYLPTRITLTASLAAGQTIIRNVSGYDAPRAYPISGSTDTLSSTINNQSVNINLADVIHPLSHFNTDDHLRDGDYSVFPNYQDQSQQYVDLSQGANRNPLGSYADGIDGANMQRGAFPYTIVANPISVGPGTPVTAIIDVAFCEPIFLPPFYFGSGNRQAFYNVNTMDFNFTFVNQMANRMWSHCPADENGAANIITSSAAFLGGTPGGPTTPFPAGQLPLMFIQYITPQETQIISPQQALTYPYFDIQRYPTQGASVGAGVDFPFSSNNIQLSSIPRRLYIFVRRQNADLYSSPSNTDTYFQIRSLSVQFMNKSGLLASASMQQLYLMSRKNHCNMNWTQWSGGPVFKTAATTISTIGSIICIEFATDIGLDSLDAPGKLGQYMIQVNCVARNISNAAITPTMYLVPILEGTFTIPELGRAMLNIGVITSQDILDAQSKPGYSYADVECVQGGNFFSGIKDFFVNKVFPAIRGFVSNKGVSNVLGLIPHPAAQVASKAASALGLGEEGGRMRSNHHGGVLLPDVGGVYAGEGQMSRKALKHRMKHY
jgi:hypothetical protein